MHNSILITVPFNQIPEKYFQLIDTAVKKEFGSSSFQAEYQIAQPDWTMLMVSVDEKALYGFVHIVDRQGTVDGQSKRIAGVMNLVIFPEYRGYNLHKIFYRSLEAFIWHFLDADLSVFFPMSKRLMKFYQRSGFQNRGFTFQGTQNSKKHTMKTNAIVCSNMSHQQPCDVEKIRLIDLNGLPW